MSMIDTQILLIGWALTYCLVYLLTRLINEKYRWAGFAGWLMVIAIPVFLTYVVISFLPLNLFIRWILTVICVMLLIGIGLWIVSKQNLARAWAGMFSVLIGFLIPCCYTIRIMHVDSPPNVDNPVGYFAAATIVGIIGSVVALAKKKRVLIYACGFVFVHQVLILSGYMAF